jgi:hypothetical protein
MGGAMDVLVWAAVSLLFCAVLACVGRDRLRARKARPWG